MPNLDYYERQSAQRQVLEQHDRYRQMYRIQAEQNAGNYVTRPFTHDPLRTRRCWCGRPADHHPDRGGHTAWGPKGPR